MLAALAQTIIEMSGKPEVTVHRGLRRLAASPPPWMETRKDQDGRRRLWAPTRSYLLDYDPTGIRTGIRNPYRDP